MKKEKQGKALSELRKHQDNVREFIGRIAIQLVNRGNKHDKSKTEYPECKIFLDEKLNSMLRVSTYGSPEYIEMLKKMKPALAHHYKVNAHHPEHYKNGIRDMSLVDLIEMFCDWKAATMRHTNGSIVQSIKKNAKRFGYSKELEQILLNTVKDLEYKQ